MILQDYLVTHALDRLWCNPEQDNQYILRGTRVTPPGGDRITAEHMGVLITLPTTRHSYHLWNVGQVDPKLLGLDTTKPYAAIGEWLHLPDSMRALNLFANIYTVDGMEVPRFRVWYQFTATRSLVFAVQHDAKLGFDMRNEQLYFRLYSNAWYRSGLQDIDNDRISIEYRDVSIMTDVLDVQGLVNQYRAKRGYVWCYVNGRLVSEISPFTATVGDAVEIVHDSSVKRVVDVPVAQLQTFLSSVDSEQKYLYHYDHDGSPHVVEYHDDIDFHITLQPTQLDKWVGHYLHRNSQAMVRMVTHRDYALSVHKTSTIGRKLIELLSSDLTVQDLKIHAIVRESTVQRPIVYDNQRVFELYKLEPQDILPAMIGTQATVPEWRAENLEASPYARMMGMPRMAVSRDVVENAYGYNGLSKLLGDTPMLTYSRNGGPSVDVPMGLYENSTAYEYDVDGVLLGQNPHVRGTIYDCNHPDAHYVEMISGRGTHRPLVLFGDSDIPLTIGAAYRVYRCYKLGGLLEGEWQDITGSDEYVVENGLVRWALPPSNQLLMVRFDNDWLGYEFDLNSVAGTFYFTLSEYEDRGNGAQHYQLPVPLGELDLWLNGRPLIRNLDYVVKFPKVHIVNQRYLKQPASNTPQRVTVRYTGFAKPDLSMDDIEDYGFIEHGLLSNNLRYDLRDDKVLRITVDGRLYVRDELEFSEHTLGVSVTDAQNGMPYQVKDIVVPMRDITMNDTYDLRAASQVIDKSVADYLTLKIPQPERPAVSAIPSRYPVVSPFLCHILHDLAVDWFDVAKLRRVLTKMEVLDLCKPYEHLMDFDPLNDDLGYDRLRTRIAVHALEQAIPLDVDKYRFFKQVVDIYGQQLVDFSQYVTVQLD